MIRALITALLLTGAATQYLHVPLDAALGYAFVICVGGWYLWPLLRRPLRYLTRFVVRQLRPRRRTRHAGRALMSRPAPAAARTAPAPQITQINHHHHYYNGMPTQQAAPLRPDYALTALPRRTEGRIASDEFLDGNIIDVDVDDDTTRHDDHHHD